jgi:TRAP transporter TAXI family solute receptor
MKGKAASLINGAISIASVLGILIAGCTPTVPSPSTSDGWKWPERLHVVARGTAGLPKYVSFTSVMEKDTGMVVRVVPEASPAKESILVKTGEMFCASIDKTGVGSQLEGREDFATRQGGPWQVRAIWIHDLSNAGFFVRGDSPVKKPQDIKPGTKIAVWDMKDSTLRWPRALLKWAQVAEKDIIWSDAGTTAAAVRSISDGRADIMFFFPINSMVYEAASAPYGIRFIDLNSDLDPAGAERLRGDIPGITFAPIEVGPEGAVGHWGTVTHKLMVTRAESDPELVYHFAKWLDENYDKYKNAFDTNQYMTIDLLTQGLENSFIPAHDGLVKYLKEKGRWTETLERRNQANISAIDALVGAYKSAIDLADKQGIAVDPNNPKWIEFWEKYKIDNKIPQIEPPLVVTAPKPTAVPTIPPPTVEGSIKFELVSITNPAYRLQEIVLVAVTEPGTEGTIRMWFSDNRESTIPFRGNEKKTADATGRLVFNGTLGHVVDGVAKLEVSLSKDGRTGKATVFTEIRRP